MKQTVNEYTFRLAFEKAGRSNQYSYEGLITLYQHLTEEELNAGEERELDVITLCGEYTEYACIMDALDDYPEYNIFTYDAFQAATEVMPVAETCRVIVRNL